MTTTVTYDTSVIYNMGAPYTFMAGTGNNLVGTIVTAYFDDNSTETVTFADSGSPRGDATGTGWSLYLNGNDGPFAGTVDPKAPYSADVWHFVFSGKSAGLTKLVIDGLTSTNYVMFDANHGTTPPDNTPGSGGGITWEVYSGLSGTNIAVTYSNCLKRTLDAAPYEDLYATITLEFSGTSVTADFAFFQDHDYADSAFELYVPPTVSRRWVQVFT